MNGGIPDDFFVELNRGIRGKAHAGVLLPPDIDIHCAQLLIGFDRRNQRSGIRNHFRNDFSFSYIIRNQQHKRFRCAESYGTLVLGIFHREPL